MGLPAHDPASAGQPRDETSITNRATDPAGLVKPAAAWGCVVFLQVEVLFPFDVTLTGC